MAKVPVTMKDSILDRLDEIRQRIAERAFDLFRGRGGSSNDPVADWLTAEQEILWKPTIELREDDGVFVVVAALPGLETKDVTVEVTPQDLVIRAETSHTRSESKGRVHLSEFSTGRGVSIAAFSEANRSSTGQSRVAKRPVEDHRSDRGNNAGNIRKGQGSLTGSSG